MFEFGVRSFYRFGLHVACCRGWCRGMVLADLVKLVRYCCSLYCFFDLLQSEEASLIVVPRS